MTKIKEFVDRIGTLDPTSKNIDDETNKKYVSIVNNDFNLLNNMILKTDITDSRKKMFRIMMLIVENFSGKKNTR